MASLKHILIASGVCLSMTAQARVLTAPEVLGLVEGHSPEFAASKFAQTAAERTIGIARSGYFPTLDFEAIDSTGFPASSGLTGVGGLMGSAYRSGAAYGVVAKETLWDFGRTSNAVSAAKHDADARKADVQVSLYQAQQEALQVYYSCARYRSLKDTWSLVSRESDVVDREVRRFVKTGQRSVVERYLVESQTQEAETAVADFSERLKKSIHLLSLLTGVTEKGLDCGALSDEDSPFLRAKKSAQSPLVLRAQAEAAAAQARADQARAGHMPRLVAVASAGEMEKSRFVPKQEYAAAGAVIFPLFDGLKTTNDVERSEALAMEKDRDLALARQRLDEINTHYDEVISSAKVRLQHLAEEQKLAEEGFTVAKKRYLAFQGSLVDLREALRNLARAKIQISDARAEYLQAVGAKTLINGME